MTRTAAPTSSTRLQGAEPPWFTGAIWAGSLIAVLAVATRLATLHGYWISKDDVIGADFATFWSAARLAVSGRAHQVFDLAAFDGAQKAMIGPGRAWAFWSYPPSSLFLYLPFARLPYLAAYAAWMAVSVAALAPVALAFVKSRRDVLLLLLCPAVAFNVLVGQNGLITAALLLGGLMLVERRPWLAGAVLGLLILKPQMALLLPVAVVAGRHWRVMGGAAASATALLALSVAAFGIEPWRAFLDHTVPAQAQMLNHGEGWFQNAMPTAFMAVRTLGAPWPAAMLGQLPFVLLGSVLVWRAWRSAADMELKGVVLVLASAVASPQMFNYDLVAFSAALLALVRRDPRPATYTLALAGWALPALCIVLSGLHVPLSPLLLAAIAWRAASNNTPATSARATARMGEAEAAERSPAPVGTYPPNPASCGFQA